MAMTPEAKGQLGKVIRGLRERLLGELGDALQAEYRLGIAAAKAKLPEAQARRRERLDAWVAEQVGAGAEAGKGGKGKKGDAAQEEAQARFRGEVVKTAAYTLMNRLVYLRLCEGSGLRPMAVVTGGWASRGYQDFRDLAPGLTGDETEGYALLLRLVFDELAADLPGLYGSVGIADLVPVPASTLRAVVEALDDGGLASCWTDDMTLGWVYQYWNDPEREALDEKLNAGGKVEPHEIASKTQMFTERYMVDWLLQNSLGPMWLALCKKRGWVAEVEADGTLARLEARRVEWRRKRDAGEVGLTELMPLETDAERRWAYFVPQVIPEDAVEKAAESVREWKVLDPAVGSGHFLVVAVDLLVALYREEARHRGEAGREEWSDRVIVERVLGENLFGIDLDPRAVQIAAAGLWLKGKGIAKDAVPARLNLVASNLRLAGLPESDPGLVAFKREVERETGIPGELTQRIVQALKGADHLGSLLKVDGAVREAVQEYEERLGKAVADQGGLFDGFAPKQERLKISVEAAKETVIGKLEGFLARHSGSEDLGLRLLGEQLAAGVRFVRMVKEGTYDLVVGNPPYLGTGSLTDSNDIERLYEDGKYDLYGAFLLRSTHLLGQRGIVAMVTLRNWLSGIRYADLRGLLLSRLRAVVDLGPHAFEEIDGEVVSVAMFSFGEVRPDNRFAGARAYALRSAAEKNASLLASSWATARADTLFAIPGRPVVFWWDTDKLRMLEQGRPLGEASPARKGLITSNDPRFLRAAWELHASRVRMSTNFGLSLADASEPWIPYVKGAKGRAWYEVLRDVIRWEHNGLEVKELNQSKYGSYSRQIMNERHYGTHAVAFSTIGSSFVARIHRFQSVIGSKGSSVYTEHPEAVACLLNNSRIREIAQDLNPGVDFTIGDVNRLPLSVDPLSDRILAIIADAFTTRESHREPSVEFRTPGPSPWRHAQAWAQQAVDRPESSPLPPYVETLDPEPATDHVSYALGIALGRFHPDGTGILDPAKADVAHALPSAILYLDGTLDLDAAHDSLAHPATTPLHTAWTAHGRAIAPKRTLRDYLRLDFFADVHRPLYENRPIHFPLSSEKRTFVAYVSIHRWTATTLRTLLADHLHPTLTRLDGQLTDLRTARDAGDTKTARAAEKRIATLQKSRDELDRFIADVTQCAEKGPRPPDAKTPAREADAPYDPDLDDGVMINAAALYPLLQPQWKDPAKWWKELATAAGRKDYDWSHLAARYWPTRVDHKCRQDPSLAVAHRCFWRYHPERAYAWELRLQDEISPTFTLDEPGSHEARAAFLTDHPATATELRAKEAKRRERKASRADDDGPQGALFDADADPDPEDLD